jgi:hypothetical protein
MIGFLVGLCPAATNLNDMREAHENHSVLYGLNLARGHRGKLT